VAVSVAVRVVVAATIAMALMQASAQAATWRIDSVPSPHVSVTKPAELSSVSCPSVSMCVAVGSYLDASENPSGALVESWNGTSWSVQSTPAVSGASLASISCPSATMCMAVGSISSSTPLAERWNGSDWSVDSGASSPSGHGGLAAISCSSATACMAVGSVTELWNGTSWTVETVPDPSSSGTTTPVTGLSSVSCSPGGACSALGSYTAHGNEEQVLTAEWNGSAWSVQGGPAPGKTYPQLNGLSCSSATACEAVGVAAESWNGTAWSKQTVSLPTGGALQGSGLIGDSCSSGAACVGVGNSTATNGKSAGIFADTFDGSGWTLEPIATPSNASQPQLTGVSCATATTCTAVGEDTDAAGTSVPLVLAYSGGSWSMQETPALTTTETTSRLSAVSCSVRGACTAVGTDAGGVLAIRSHAGGWSIQSAPNPAGPADPSTTMPMPASIACPAVSACLMVGSFMNAAGNPDDFAERWNGARWSLQRTPSENDDDATTLDAVSCPSARRCLAAGGEDIGVGEPMSTTSSAITEQWTGSRWIFQRRQPRSPAQGAGESPDNELTGLSCSSTEHCTAVGIASTGGPCRRCGNLAERFNGRGWSLQRPSQIGELQDVSCPTASRCVAVGGGTTQVWNGATWSPTRLRHGELTSVSCPTSRRCAAVGTVARQVLVERWNGSSWSRQSAPEPVGATHISVSGVSCPTMRSCVLVGSYERAGQSVSLIESYS
jgi:hypothetical protein